MATILILGGYGATGRLLARRLLEQSEAEIVLAGRRLEQARAYAEQLNAEFQGGRVSARRADAADEPSLRQALRNVDFLLVAAPTTQHAESVIRTALDCGVDYLDVQISAHKIAVLKALAPEIERAGRCFITEAGLHPGLPAALIRYAAAYFDRLEIANTAAYLNMGRTLPYSEAVDELLEMFRNFENMVFRNGQWQRTGSFDLRKMDFGGEIGSRRCYAMFLEELRALPEMYPALKEVGFYISETHWLLDWVISLVVMAGLRIAPRRASRPLGKLFWWGMRTLPKPPYLVLLKVDARGEKDGQPAQVEICVSHPDGYELTAIPVVACLLQYLDGSARRPGVWMMGQLVEPVRLFRDMERMGVRVTVGVQLPFRSE